MRHVLRRCRPYALRTHHLYAATRTHVRPHAIAHMGTHVAADVVRVGGHILRITSGKIMRRMAP